MQYVKTSSHGSSYSGHQSEVIGQSLDHLYAMAQRYRGEGSLRQAMEIYWTLSDHHRETAQGQGAQDGLLELADVFENDGSRHQARAIYERLSN